MQNTNMKNLSTECIVLLLAHAVILKTPTQHIVSSELNRLSIVNVDLFIFKVSTWHKRVLTSKFSLNLTDLICFHTQLTNFPI